jgi:hypothetical protein
LHTFYSSHQPQVAKAKAAELEKFESQKQQNNSISYDADCCADDIVDKPKSKTEQLVEQFLTAFVQLPMDRMSPEEALAEVLQLRNRLNLNDPEVIKQL